MLRLLSKVLVLSVLMGRVESGAQMTDVASVPGEKVDAEVALNRALKTSSLTFEGRPFHAVMLIASAEKGYSGRVEVWWVSGSKYRLVVASPQFSQEKVVNGDRTAEKNDGDYYPRWLENFVLALMDPVPMEKNFRGRTGTVMLGPEVTSSCLRRDDRPGGITDQLTWGMVCFSGSEPRLASVLTTNVSIEFKDWKRFDEKQIARTYQTDVLDYRPVMGRLTTLEELRQPDEAMFVVSAATPMEERIGTMFVSTLEEESLVETVPEIQWPTVPEGKTEGYMIVYARTDRTGQVRETAKHNSDNARLEQFGMEQALKYKFKPLVVNGVAQQMEMPLVLHFKSKVEDPLPVLSVEEMKNQMGSCRVGSLPPGSAKVTLRVSVDEKGSLTGFGPVGDVQGANWLGAMLPMRSCRFKPYLVDGRVTYYHGLLELTAPQVSAP